MAKNRFFSCKFFVLCLHRNRQREINSLSLVWSKPGFRVAKKAKKNGFSGSGKPGLQTLILSAVKTVKQSCKNIFPPEEFVDGPSLGVAHRKRLQTSRVAACDSSLSIPREEKCLKNKAEADQDIK